MIGFARWAERFLFAIGFLILGYCGAGWLSSRYAQIRGSRELDRVRTEAPLSARRDAPIPEGGLIGKVEISRLHLSAVVFQGMDDSILDRGVGHLDASPLPGQAGNVVLAAHRDTFFRGLRNIAKGDMINLTTPTGVRSYTVQSTQIVNPDQTSVMDPTPEPALTLITCYPFYYVGHAPKRFIVRAVEVDGLPNRSPATSLIAAQSEGVHAGPGRPIQTENPDPESLTYLFRASSE